jgi:hypothetical protein
MSDSPSIGGEREMENFEEPTAPNLGKGETFHWPPVTQFYPMYLKRFKLFPTPGIDSPEEDPLDPRVREQILSLMQSRWEQKEGIDTLLSRFYTGIGPEKFISRLTNAFHNAATSEASCERMFSKIKLIIGYQRGNLNTSTLFSLIFLSTFERNNSFE